MSDTPWLLRARGSERLQRRRSQAREIWLGSPLGPAGSPAWPPGGAALVSRTSWSLDPAPGGLRGRSIRGQAGRVTRAAGYTVLRRVLAVFVTLDGGAKPTGPGGADPGIGRTIPLSLLRVCPAWHELLSSGCICQREHPAVRLPHLANNIACGELLFPSSVLWLLSRLGFPVWRADMEAT
jgi:hypothetical protein